MESIDLQLIPVIQLLATLSDDYMFFPVDTNESSVDFFAAFACCLQEFAVVGSININGHLELPG